MHKGFSEEGQPVRIPNSYKDAQKSPQWGDWNNAIQKEMDSLRKHNVYKLTKMSSVPKEEKIIGSRFVFKQKVDGRFKSQIRRSRLRTRGWGRLREKLRPSVPHREHKDSTRHRMRARMARLTS